MAVVVPLAHARRVDERGGSVVRLGEALGPISPELALVDPDLATRARALLPDPVEPLRRPPPVVAEPPPPGPEDPELLEPLGPSEPVGPPRDLLLPEPPPDPPAVPEPVAAPAALPPATVVEEAPPSRRRLPARRGIVVPVAALLVLAAGLAVWLNLASGDDARPTGVDGEAPLEFSAPPSDPSLAPSAVAALERQARIEPRSPLVREKLGSVYLRLGRWADAERELRALVALTPNDGFAHFALGRALDEQGRRAEAKAYFARADELGRDDPSSIAPSP